MSTELDLLNELLHGPAWSEARAWPLTLTVRWCDLRPRFIPKGRVGRSYRAIARNGRVLLASNVTLANLAGRIASLRIQTWHKAVLPGDRPGPHGILLVLRTLDEETAAFEARLSRPAAGPCDQSIDVGGGSRLEFHRAAE
jgi:hypothetical protein